MGLKHNAQNMPRGGNSTPVTQFAKSGGILLITPSEKKTPHPAMASAHHHTGFSILALQLPGTGIRTHARHCGVTSTLCAKGGCFVCVLRTCSSLRCSSRRHPRKPQPRGLPESPIFWKEQPCKIRRVLLSCLPSLSVITILNKMNECHTLS